MLFPVWFEDFQVKYANRMLKDGSAIRAGNKATLAVPLAAASPVGSSVELDSLGQLSAAGTVSVTLQSGPFGTPLAQVEITPIAITLQLGPPVGKPLAQFHHPA